MQRWFEHDVPNTAHRGGIHFDLRQTGRNLNVLGSLLENHMKTFRIASVKLLNESVKHSNKLSDSFETCQIKEPIFEEVRTAHISKLGNSWIGFLPAEPKVGKLEGDTKKSLLESLSKKLYEVLETEDKEWDNRTDARLTQDDLRSYRKKVLEDVKKGEFTHA